MKKVLPFVLIMVMLTSICHPHQIQAMLFGYLPADGSDRSQYTELARLIQEYLDEQKIAVTVKVCSKAQCKKIYKKDEILELWQTYDIIQIDDMFQSVLQTPGAPKLMAFKKQEINYFDLVYPFEWKPLINQNGELIGSPGLVCTDFVQTKSPSPTQILNNQMVSGFNYSYSLASLYANFYLNQSPENTLENMSYDTLNEQVFSKVKYFLKQCQLNQEQFNFESNQCLKNEYSPYFSADYQNYSSTTGYTEQLFEFFKNYPENEPFKLNHIMGKTSNSKLVYLDSFFAKENTIVHKIFNYKATVLRFYQSMLSEHVQSIYTSGKYTDSKSTTYLLPATKAHFEKVKTQDKYYSMYYDELQPQNPNITPIFGDAYLNGFQELFEKIITRLKEPSKDISDDL